MMALDKCVQCMQKLHYYSKDLPNTKLPCEVVLSVDTFTTLWVCVSCTEDSKRQQPVRSKPCVLQGNLNTFASFKASCSYIQSKKRAHCKHAHAHVTGSALIKLNMAYEVTICFIESSLCHPTATYSTVMGSQLGHFSHVQFWAVCRFDFQSCGIFYTQELIVLTTTRKPSLVGHKQGQMLLHQCLHESDYTLTFTLCS